MAYLDWRTGDRGFGRWGRFTGYGRRRGSLLRKIDGAKMHPQKWAHSAARSNGKCGMISWSFPLR